MKTQTIHYFKSSGKWYSQGELAIDENMPYLEVQLTVARMHGNVPMPGLYGDARDFDVLVMGDAHPSGYPFISRAKQV